MSNENTALVRFEELPTIAANAGAILAKNTDLHDRAIRKGQSYLDTIEAGDMTAELFNEVVTYLGNVVTYKGKLNDGRAPITKFFTAIASEFTTLENDMDKAKPGTVPYQLQIACNNYVKEEERKKEAQRQELQRQNLAKQERIDITGRVEAIVRQKYLDTMLKYKGAASTLFNTMTLENSTEIEKSIKALPDTYPRKKFVLIEVSVVSNYIPKDELAGIIYETKVGLYPELSANFKESMAEAKMLVLDQIPARTVELQEIAAAGAKRRKEMEAAAELRRKEQELQQQREAQEAQRKQDEAAELSKDIKQAELSFDSEVQTAEIMGVDAPATKKAYIINVKTSAGWMMITNLWFKEFGNKMPLDKFSKKTFDSMKGDLEKLAFNGGERLNDSIHLVYELDVKAVIRK